MWKSATRNADALVRRLGDRRSWKVIFVSHCVLNENTRYLGGACRGGCVREIVQQCIDQEIGIVQMPCPEQAVWGGVLKRRLLRLYGARGAKRLDKLAVAYTRRNYRQLARQIAAQIEDYVVSGFVVVGVVAVDGSPSCGLRTTLDLSGALAAIGETDPRTISVARQNALVTAHARSGRGIFIEELQEQLSRRGLDVPFLAHDLFEELDGRPCSLALHTHST